MGLKLILQWIVYSLSRSLLILVAEFFVSKTKEKSEVSSTSNFTSKDSPSGRSSTEIFAKATYLRLNFGVLQH